MQKDHVAGEDLKGFVRRKQEHIEQSLNPANQAEGLANFEIIEFQHEALPEMNFSDVEIDVRSLGERLSTPFFVSSMTAGHPGANKINLNIAKACQKTGWTMAVGSQRRQLFDRKAKQEWKEFGDSFSDVNFYANIGLSQLIVSEVEEIQGLVDSLSATALFIHTNPLQECLQTEGTPHFQGGLKSLERLTKSLKVPVVLKETGCGFSESSLRKLKKIGLSAIDVSGLGGTHWGRIEGQRSGSSDILKRSSQSFANWGVSTIESLMAAKSVELKCEVWASGGIRNGLDAAKCIHLGAKRVGLAKPILEGAVEGVEEVISIMETFEYELKVAMFCTGSKTLKDLKREEIIK